MRRLHHLALRTDDVERLVAFYCAWFGLAELRDQRPRAVWLSIAPDAVLMIEQRDANEPAPAADSRELIALAGTSEERRSLRERLVRAGLLEGESEHTVYFRDPDGRRVALSSYPLPQRESHDAEPRKRRRPHP